MRKTLSTIILTFALVLTGASAIAATTPDDPIVYCNDAPDTGPAGCVPIVCKATIDRLLIGYTARIGQRDIIIASQRSRIHRQARVIRHLRGELRRERATH